MWDNFLFSDMNGWAIGRYVDVERGSTNSREAGGVSPKLKN